MKSFWDTNWPAWILAASIWFAGFMWLFGEDLSSKSYAYWLFWIGVNALTMRAGAWLAERERTA